MYDLPCHKEHDARVIARFVADYPFAFLAGCGSEGRPAATQVPLFLEQEEGHSVLRGHLMRNTDHHRAFQANDQVLAVFAGPHAYVSGTWYSDPHTPSTWNYMSVHARGRIRFLDGAALEDMLQQTSLHFEDGNRDSPTVFDNLPVALKTRVLGAIVAFEIEVTAMDAVFKLSQDRDPQSYRTIIEKLSDRGDYGRRVAAEMEKRTNQVFRGQQKE